VAGFIVLILADAAQLLLFVPDRTAELFAWDIQPEATALVLASAYVGGGYFFVRVLFGAPWREVAPGFPPVIVFVWMAGAATFLHLDRFITGNLAFAAWIALYVVTPFAVPALYLHNRSRARPGTPLARGLRLALAAAGGVVVLVGLVMLVAPDVAIDAWPWTLTALTARIIAAVVALFGSVWVAVAVDGTVEGSRIPLTAPVIGLAFFLIALRHGDALVTGPGFVAVAMLVASAVILGTEKGPPRRGSATVL
jgi:hypothetical protein